MGLTFGFRPLEVFEEIFDFQSLSIEESSDLVGECDDEVDAHACRINRGAYNAQLRVHSDGDGIILHFVILLKHKNSPFNS